MSSAAVLLFALTAVALVGSLIWALRLRARLGGESARASRELEGRALAERELLLRTLLDASPLAIVFYGEAGRIVFANGPAQRMFFEDQPAEGKNFLRLVSSGPEAFRSALLGANDEVRSFEIDGQRETYHFVRRTFSYAEEPHTLLVVRHVTREVARHELDVLKRVVRLLSHEVNNSLAPVSSLIHSARQIVKSGERPERLERVFGTIDERAKHLSEFIAGYAALARLPRPNPQEVAWEQVLNRLRVLYPQALLRAAANARGFFDPGQIEQALINLLKNAHEAGGPPEQVELEVVVLEDASAEVRIADRGQGFSAESLENAVLPFFTTKPGGSGVGLALVREIVDAHHGQLTLAPRPEGGALVTLRLPDPRKRAVGGESHTARLTLTRA